MSRRYSLANGSVARPSFQSDQDSRAFTLWDCNAIHPTVPVRPRNARRRSWTLSNPWFSILKGKLEPEHNAIQREPVLHILILSPHRNDAAFSLGLAIESWLAAKHRVTVLGVFTRSATAPFSDADTVHPNDLLTYVSGMRRKEDAELLKLLPKLRMEDLNLKDAPIRLRCSVDEEYIIAPSATDTAIPKIEKALANLDAQTKVDAILLPIGLGHHVDHLVVRNAALAFGATRACAFYEELPDALREGEAFDPDRDLQPAIDSELADLNQPLAPFVMDAGKNSDAAISRKRKLISGYASQIDEQTMQTISAFAARYGRGERVWGNTLWSAKLNLTPSPSL